MAIVAQTTDGLGAVGPLMFYIFALLVCISAWAIVLNRNIVRMAVCLLATLAGSAGMYFMLEAEFLAAIQLIVYAGGTLILIIFGVMLTSKNPFTHFRVQLWEQMVAVALALALGGLVLFALVRTPHVTGANQLAPSSGYEQVQAIGEGFLTSQLVAFEVAGVLLLVVMVGAAYMARRRRNS